MSVTGGVTQLDELHLTTDLADAYIASAATWNGKFTLPALTSGSVLFSDGTTIAQKNAQLFWDNTNNRLGIGTAAPNFKLTISDGTRTGGFNPSSGLNAFAFGTSTNHALIFSTNNNDVGRFFANGNFAIGTTTDAGFRLDVNGTARVSGDVTLSNKLNLSGNNFSSTYKILVNTQPSSGDLVSGVKNCFHDQVNFANFNLNSGTVYNSFVSNPTINQTNGANGITRGLYINPTLTSAADFRAIEWSNNSGWGLYGGGTANNYLAGNLGIGILALAGRKLIIGGNITGAVTSYGMLSVPTIQSDVTSSYRAFHSEPSVAASVTTSEIRHFTAVQGTFGLGSAVTTQVGYWAHSSLTGATNNYGFYGDIASGTGRWNIYINGTAANYMNGNLLLGTTTDVASSKLTIASTTQGFLPPRMTTTQKNAIASPAAGLVVYDTTLNKLCVRGAAAWETITSI